MAARVVTRLIAAFSPMLLFLSRCLALLPLAALHAVGRGFGRLIYALPGRYRRRLRANARQAGYADAGFARRAAAQTGAMIAETPKVWLRPASCLDKTECPDSNVLRAALAEGRGLLNLTPHLGCFEIIARFLASHGRTTVMYKPPHQAVLAPVMETARNLPGLTAVSANHQGVRAFVRALRAGEIVGMLPDQAPGGGAGVWVPFFGAQALTMTLAGRLAQHAPVVLTAAERLPRGRGWRVHVLRLAEPLPQDPSALATLINQSMETLIRRFPEQYLWSYNRYKTPAGAPPRPQEAPA